MLFTDSDPGRKSGARSCDIAGGPFGLAASVVEVLDGKDVRAVG